MGRRSAFAVAIISAFALTAANLLLLAWRTSSSSEGGGGNDTLALGRPSEGFGIELNNNETGLLVDREFQPGFERRAWLESCQQLLAHENGHWKHNFHSEGRAPFLNHRSTHQMYFPMEKGWLRGNSLPENFAKCTWSNKYFMYKSLLGHQCGCGVKGFAPSHSVWVHNVTSGMSSPNGANPGYPEASPTVLLARRLADANATLCFSGDSIDYQIYVAMQNNLQRMHQLHQLYNPGKSKLFSVAKREIMVTGKYPTQPGKVDDWWLRGRRPPDGETLHFLALHQTAATNEQA
ncbi:hypothetical protein ACHAWF_002657 [Thalassiosira exigua]